MNAAVPLTCRTCGEPMAPTDERCPFGHVNPDYTRTLLRQMEGDTRTAVPAERPAFGTLLNGLANELARARASGCKVIVNVGQSEAGKSWLIARMGVTRPGTHRATLYAERRPPSEQVQEQVMRTGTALPRTSSDEIYVWHLEPNDPGEGRATASGAWRIIDIAGELVSDPQLVRNITSGRPLYDLLTMTLAHASAVVVVIDGEELSREDGEGAIPEGAARSSVDEQNERMLNGLVRVLRFLKHHTADQPPENLGALEALKDKIRNNPQLDLGVESRMLPVPVLLMVSKSDRVPGLGEGADPLRYAATRLPLTHAKAVQTVRVVRWAAAAPFAGQSQAADAADYTPGAAAARERLDFQRPSYGVGQALDWLDAELARRKTGTGLSTQQALGQVSRWFPWTGASRLRKPRGRRDAGARR